MELKKEKIVRFHYDGKEQKTFLTWGRTNPANQDNSSSVYKVSSSMLKTEDRFLCRSKIGETLKFGKSNVFPEEPEPWRKRILDPGSEIVLQWNRFFIFSCLVALFVDPLYFYLPSIAGTGNSQCVKSDLDLRIVVTCFRTVADFFYLLHVVIKFRTAYVAPSSRVFGRGELVMDPKKIARRYIRSDFFIDLIATLPLPQVLCLQFHYDGKEQKTFLAWGRTNPANQDNSSSGYKVSSSMLKTEDRFLGRSKIRETLKFGKSKVFPEEPEPWRKRILDPGSEIVLQWNRFFIFSCLVALFVDPLYFYLPSIAGTGNSQCVKSDLDLRIVVTCFRTVADFFYLLHVVIKFRTAYVAPSSRVFGRGELVMDPKKIARRYIRSDFFIDLIATLPLPQIVIWFMIPVTRSPQADHNNNALALIVLFQYVPRLYVIFPLSLQLIKATGVVTKTAWAGAAYNLLLYMLASHVLGAAWYLLSVDRYTSCWKSICKKEVGPPKCLLHFLDCDTFDEDGRGIWANSTTVFNNCDPGNSITFNYGIFENAVTKNVVSSSFIEKYFYCLWWGLQNLSSYGQTLSTSTFIGETLFAILIAILGLVLFAHLIGNMQSYLQSITMRLEEWRLKRRDTEEWMRHRQLPEDLKQRVRRFVHYKWLATRGVDEETILRGLPADLRRDIQRHLCLDLVRRVPFFSQMDDQLLDAICERLVSSLSTEGTYTVREGDPVAEMLFIIRGRLESSTTNGGRTGFFNSIMLRQGDFCGEELLAWALLPKSTTNLPSSTRTVRALIEVEAFALRAEDLKFVANQFRRLHSKKLQHTFRFYSHHWRTWAACFIQAAWQRYKRRLTKGRIMVESFAESGTGQEDEQDGSSVTSSPSQAKMNFGVTILASRFAANTRRGAQKTKDLGMPTLRKPEEPDFSAEPDD